MQTDIFGSKIFNYNFLNSNRNSFAEYQNNLTFKKSDSPNKTLISFKLQAAKT